MGESIKYLIATVFLLVVTMPAWAKNLPVDIYLIPERGICFGNDAFDKCKKINNENIDAFITDSLEAGGEKISIAVPGKISSTRPKDVKSFFRSVRSYSIRSSEPSPSTQKKTKAAVFVFDLSKFTAKAVTIYRKQPDKPIKEKTTRMPGKRFVHWYDAKSVNPSEKVKFGLRVDGRNFPFEFKK